MLDFLRFLSRYKFHVTPFILWCFLCFPIVAAFSGSVIIYFLLYATTEVTFFVRRLCTRSLPVSARKKYMYIILIIITILS